MGELETEPDALQMFAASGRMGRRNALPEIEVSLKISSLLVGIRIRSKTGPLPFEFHSFPQKKDKHCSD